MSIPNEHFEQTFADQEISLVKGSTYVDCVFTRCVINYDGSELLWLENNTFHDCRWHFVGAAENVLRVLASLPPEAVSAALAALRQASSASK